MEEKNKYIEIVLATDDNYTKYCATTMVSILENTKNPIRFHIFDGGVQEYHKNKLLKLENKYNCNILFYSMKNLHLPDVPLNRNWISIATYYRLFITDLISSNIDKIIYLDCDTVVDKDIADLWEYDISEYMAGIIEDEDSVLNNTRLNLSKAHTYFNAGVLLLNLKVLREFNLKEKAFTYLRDNIHKIKLQDQDILNGIFESKCLRLPLKYNVNTTMYSPFNQNCSHNAQEVNEAKKFPVIIHYTGLIKPWHYPQYEQSDYFWTYARLTPFYEEILYESVCGNSLRKVVRNVIKRKRLYFKYVILKVLKKIVKGEKKEIITINAQNLKSQIDDYRKTLYK